MTNLDSQRDSHSGFREKQVLVERYEILSEIGSGGLSTVYTAKDLVLKRVIAIKLLKSQSNEQYVIRLQREAKAICHLKHKNIIEVYDFFMAEGNVPVLAMEYIKGESLDELIKRKGPLPTQMAYDVFQQICSAIAYAHERHILHRDLKPGNVLLRELKNGKLEVKIIDFGIAKMLDDAEGSLTGAGAMIGTPSFLSPEQALGQTVDQRSDIYSLGCLMYKSLTGRAPFRGSTSVEVVNAQIYDAAPSLSEGNEKFEFSDEIEEVVARALEKDPDERFQTVDELAESVRYLIVEAGITSSEDVEAPNSLRRSSWQLHAAVALCVVLIVALVGGIGYVMSQSDNLLETQQAKSDKLFLSRRKHNVQKRWVRNWEWIDLEGTVTDEQLIFLPQLDCKRLDLAGSSITDGQLTHLVDLPLVSLDLRDTKITDRGLESILKIEGLQTLLMERCPGISHQGYRSLAKLKSLKILSLRDTNVSDEDLKEISKLSNLILLYVSNSPHITDAGIDQILKLEKLISVRIGSTKVTTVGIDKLKPHPTLVFYGIDDLDLSDDKMPLSFNQKISMLDLSRNPLTYRGLRSVLALKDIWFLDLRQCPGIDKLAENKLSARFRVEEFKVCLADGPARGVFSDFETEWYFEPEYYKKSATDAPLEQRKQLIRDVFEGPSSSNN
ncbi:MAG: protein kinase [Candidatus Melainabacteria bacterium]|nr:protein kinase [Candidatus Melainabacteria bacterium]